MNFHSECNCKLEPPIEIGEVKHYAITSGKLHVGTIRFCPNLKEWELSLCQYTSVTYGFMSKVWECLFNELTTTS